MYTTKLTYKIHENALCARAQRKYRQPPAAGMAGFVFRPIIIFPIECIFFPLFGERNDARRKAALFCHKYLAPLWTQHDALWERETVEL